MSSINPEYWCLNLDWEYEAPNFPGILHSSRFHPILEVNNRPYSNPGYLIFILYTSLFNIEVVYNALLLSTKELHPSMKTDCTKCWEFERMLRVAAVFKSPKTSRSWESSVRRLLGVRQGFHSQSKHFSAHQYFLSRRTARQKAEWGHPHLGIGKKIMFAIIGISLEHFIENQIFTWNSNSINICRSTLP